MPVFRVYTTSEADGETVSVSAPKLRAANAENARKRAVRNEMDKLHERRPGAQSYDVRITLTERIS